MIINEQFAIEIPDANADKMLCSADAIEFIVGHPQVSTPSMYPYVHIYIFGAYYCSCRLNSAAILPSMNVAILIYVPLMRNDFLPAYHVVLASTLAWYLGVHSFIVTRVH